MAVASLQQSCIQRIAKDMEFWCPSTTDNFSGYLYVLGPFDHLGSRQIQQLITILAKKRELKPHHFHGLLHCGITFLDLSSCKYLVSDVLIQMITKRCKKLSHLSLATCSRISTWLIQDLPKTLTNLKSLDLSRCPSCDDNVLISLGEHCKHLQILKVESCQKVTDHGVKALKSNPNLTEIDLSATNVSPHGVFMLLQNHQHLQSLSLSMCDTALYNQPIEVEYFDKSFLSLGVTRLKYLDLSFSSANDVSLSVVARICPDISSLSIHGFCGSSQSLLHIKMLKHLNHLKLSGMDIESIYSFELQEFLKECGSHLETLFFPGTKSIDSGLIARYCPNLTKLCLAGSTEVTGSLAQHGNERFTLLEACPCLKILDLQHCSFPTLSLRDHFSAIFSRSVSILEELHLTNVIPDFTPEELLQYIVCFSNLKILNISLNHFVDKDLVLKIVHCCKRLLQLNVSECWNVKLCDVEEARQLIAQLGRQTKIIWS